MPHAEVVAFIRDYAAPRRRPGPSRGTTVIGAAADARRLRGRHRSTVSGAADAVVLATGACNVARVPAVRRRPPAVDRAAHPADLPRARTSSPTAACWWSARRPPGPARRRDPPLGRPGHPRRRRARPHAADVPRARHLLVDGRRRARRAHDEVDDIVRARHIPSPQLDRHARAPHPRPQRPQRARRPARRPTRRASPTAWPSSPGSLANVCALADLKMDRLLDRFDDWAAHARASTPSSSRPHRFEPTQVDPTPCSSSTSTRGDIGTVVWATGYRPDYSWLDVPVLDHTGRIRHDGGVVRDAPGLYLLGTPLLRRRAVDLHQRRRRRHRSDRQPPPVASGQPYRPATTPCP